MAKVGNASKYARFAAIFYASFTTYTIYSGISTYSRNGVSIPILSIVFWILLTAITISLCFAYKNLLTIIAGLCIIYDIILFTRSLTLGTALGIVPTVTLLVILILAVKGRNISYLWFIPAASRYDQYIFQWLTGRYLQFLNTSLMWTMLLSLTEVVALLFIGIWLNMSIRNQRIKS